MYEPHFVFMKSHFGSITIVLKCPHKLQSEKHAHCSKLNKIVIYTQIFHLIVLYTQASIQNSKLAAKVGNYGVSV